MLESARRNAIMSAEHSYDQVDSLLEAVYKRSGWCAKYIPSNSGLLGARCVTTRVSILMLKSSVLLVVLLSSEFGLC